jgi:hypothetical protein
MSAGAKPKLFREFGGHTHVSLMLSGAQIDVVVEALLVARSEWGAKSAVVDEPECGLLMLRALIAKHVLDVIKGKVSFDDQRSDHEPPEGA